MELSLIKLDKIRLGESLRRSRARLEVVMTWACSLPVEILTGSPPLLHKVPDPRELALWLPRILH